MDSKLPLREKQGTGVHCSSTFGMLQSPNQILLPAGSALKELRPWRRLLCTFSCSYLYS